MRRKALERLLIVALGLAAPGAVAQPMLKGGGGGMPDLAQIVGRALPDRGMPTGTVSVRVARKMPANAVAGSEVSAIIKNACGGNRSPSPGSAFCCRTGVANQCTLAPTTRPLND